MSELIQSVRHGRIHELRLARPPVNAINPALCAALRDSIAAAVDAGAEGLVLSGGSLEPFFSRPISIVLWVSILITFLLGITAVQNSLGRLFRRRKPPAGEDA